MFCIFVFQQLHVIISWRISPAKTNDRAIYTLIWIGIVLHNFSDNEMFRAWSTVILVVSLWAQWEQQHVRRFAFYALDLLYTYLAWLDCLFLIFSFPDDHPPPHRDSYFFCFSLCTYIPALPPPHRALTKNTYIKSPPAQYTPPYVYRTELA